MVRTHANDLVSATPGNKRGPIRLFTNSLSMLTLVQVLERKTTNWGEGKTNQNGIRISNHH